MRLSRLATIASKEWREVVRDRLLFALAFIMPPMLEVLIGFGFSFDVENVPIAIVDYDRSTMSRDYAYRFVSSRHFDFRGFLDSERDINALLMSNKIRAAVVIPEKFQERLSSGISVTLQALIDGTFPSRAQIVRGYLESINRTVSTELTAAHLARIRGLPIGEFQKLLRPVDVEVRYLFNESARSGWSVAPKLIMLILLFAPAFLVSLSVVREKETGAIYNIHASTASRLEFIGGKLTPYVGIYLLNVPILVFLATTVFDAPFRGDFFFFLFASLLYIICTTGIGIVISLLVRTQMAATIVSLIVTLTPAVLYSGLFIPIQSLGPEARVLARLVPAMYFTSLVDGCFLKGVGVRILWRDIFALAVYAVAVLALAHFLFRKRTAK